MKQIRSRDNAAFKALRALVEDHREPRRRGETLVDGVHLVATCLARDMPIHQLVVSESGRVHPEVTPLIAGPHGERAIELSDALFREATGVAQPVGIAAVIPIPATATAPLTGDAVLFDAVQDAGNVGTILRTAAAAGVRHAILGKGCAGAWTPRVLRAGQGAHFALDIREQADLDAVLAGFPGISVATVARDGTSLYELDLRGPVAWLLGNEGAGLSPALAAAASRRATIPLAGATESLNVGAAAAVCLFEACRQRRLSQ